MNPFATYTDLESGWRPLSVTERVWAAQLLGAAARWIYRNTAVTDPLDEDAKLVSLAVVRSALGPGEFTGYSNFSKALGPRSRSGTLVNPGGALIWEDWMKELLGVSVETTAIGHFGNGGCSGRW